MKTLISLPPNLVDVFHQLQNRGEDWYCTSDPIGSRLGSGGGTAHLLESCYQGASSNSFESWLSEDKRILIHAGGQSRRLPAYGPSGKILTPIPILRWARGQRVDQNLLDLQRPLMEELMEKAPDGTHTLIASGDVLIHGVKTIPNLPKADVICIGLWSQPETAKNHGVFFTSRNEESKLAFMLQKPSVEKIRELSHEYNFMIDVGIWLLSDRAIKLLMSKCGWNEKAQSFSEELPSYYDLYSDFGPLLGNEIEEKVDSLSLTSAVVHLEGGGFYHFGRSSDLVHSSLALQNLVEDQRSIFTRDQKPHSELFVQNSTVRVSLKDSHEKVWVENSVLSNNCSLKQRHVITGLPDNDWSLSFTEGQCLDMLPLKDGRWVVRPYGYTDEFRGDVSSDETLYLEGSLKQWLDKRSLSLDDSVDIQDAPLFLPLKLEEIDQAWVQWLLSPEPDVSEHFSKRWQEGDRLSANDLSDQADILSLVSQRALRMRENIDVLAKHNRRSVFFQLDLRDLAEKILESGIDFSFPGDRKELTSFSQMQLSALEGQLEKDQSKGGRRALEGLKEELTQAISEEAKAHPKLDVQSDQIVWARSPVRLDLAGGWTDTPPYCLLNGGRVVNVAVELNGQPPIQVFIRPNSDYRINLRSIDLGTEEIVTDFEALLTNSGAVSEFSIPKVALSLVGFLPKGDETLESCLKNFGAGFDVSFLSAIPKGSGLGTSSVLSSTILAALSDFCGLGWDTSVIGRKTLLLEQILTTGGGWQDQYGGMLGGAKYLETDPGVVQVPKVRWLPERLFEGLQAKSSMLLYYTGMTRLAKNILGEIVQGMFLNDRDVLETISAIREHALETYDILQSGEYQDLAMAVKKSWMLNQKLDVGTNPPEIQSLISSIEEHILGVKLLGAGGGGYMLIMAKDPTAAERIRETLESNPPNDRARLIEFQLSKQGLQVTRS